MIVFFNQLQKGEGTHLFLNFKVCRSYFFQLFGKMNPPPPVVNRNFLRHVHMVPGINQLIIL